VARKIAANLRALGATRFDLKYGMPDLTHDQLMTNIELYGRKVIPLARELLATESPVQPPRTRQRPPAGGISPPRRGGFFRANGD
jgi:hypothetical protein